MSFRSTRDSLKSVFGDNIHFSRDGTATVKRGFFYRMGGSAQKLAERVKSIVPEAEIIKAEEHYNSWPRDSF